jgi:hypothetical protein
VTFDDVMEELWPGSSPEARDELLWITPFPFVAGDKVVQELRDLRTKYGPDIGDAIDGEMAAFDEEFRMYMEQEHLQHSINLQGSLP